MLRVLTYVLAGIGGFFSLLLGGCLFMFVWPLSLFNKHWLLWLPGLLLLPVSLAGAALGMILYPLAAIPGMWAMFLGGLHGEPEEAGIRFSRKISREDRFIPWSGVAYIRWVFRAPSMCADVHLTGGEVVKPALLSVKRLEKYVKIHEIPNGHEPLSPEGPATDLP